MPNKVACCHDATFWSFRKDGFMLEFQPLPICRRSWAPASGSFDVSEGLEATLCCLGMVVLSLSLSSHCRYTSLHITSLDRLGFICLGIACLPWCVYLIVYIGPVLSFSCHFYVISSCSSSLNSSHPRNQILKMSHSGIADFPALTVPVPRGTLHNYSASWSTAPAKSLQPCSFPSQWRVVNHGKPLVWFFFSKVEAFLFFCHKALCNTWGYVRVTVHPPWGRVDTGLWCVTRQGKHEGSALGRMMENFHPPNQWWLWHLCGLASFHTDTPLGTPFQ